MDRKELPESRRLLAIMFAMYYNDYGPAHSHTRYGDSEIRVAITDRRILSGANPRRAQSLVQEWARLHRDELREDWLLARQRKPLMKIAPLE